MKSNSSSWIIVGIILLIILHIFASTTFAMTFQKDENIVIGEGEVFDGDLFLIGKTVTFQGTVKGDLFVAAKDVAIDGHVEESVFIAGNHVVISGIVEDDAHIAALCIAYGVSELWSADRDFSRFSGLRAKNPLVG